MLIEFMAAFAAAFVGAGIAMLLRLMTKGRMPRVMIPIFAGLGMLGFTIWGEYAWFDRTAGALPDDVVVVQTHAEPSTYRPWTHLRPFVNRFMAVDTTTVRTNVNVPEQRLAEVLLFAHRAPAETGFENPVGRVDLHDLCADGREQDLIAEHLDRTGRRARASPDETDKEDHHHRKRAPPHVVGAGIPCPG